MAKASGTDLAGFDAQLATTQMFYARGGGRPSPRARSWPQTMDCVRKFSVRARASSAGRRARRGRHRVPGRQGARRRRNVKLRFDPRPTWSSRPAASSEPSDAAACASSIDGPRRRAGGCMLGALPFVLLVASPTWSARRARLAANPNDKLLPAFADAAAPARDRLRAGPALGRLPALADTAASLRPARRPASARGADRRSCSASRSASFPRVPGHARGLRGRAVVIPPLGRAADPVHRLRPRRASKIDADRDRHRARHGARHRVPRSASIPHELIVKAQTLGASSWQIVTRVVLPHDPAAADHLRPARARAGLAVPDRRRGDRRHRGPGLPHLPGPPLSSPWT